MAAEKATTATIVAAGRPRDPRVDTAILEATRALLVEVGYSRLSFELVARRANVTRPTIYRRWPSKMHLVHAAVFPEHGVKPIPDTGRFERDLHQMIRNTLASYARPEAQAALPGLIADLHRDDSLRHSVIDRLENQVRAQLAQVVAAAIERREVSAGTDPDVLLDSVVGALFHRVVARGLRSPRFADELVALLLQGLLRRP